MLEPRRRCGSATTAYAVWRTEHCLEITLLTRSRTRSSSSSIRAAEHVRSSRFGSSSYPTRVVDRLLFERLKEVVRVHRLSERRGLSDRVRRVDERSLGHARLGLSQGSLCSSLVLAVEGHGLTREDVREGAFVAKLAVSLCEPLADWFRLSREEESKRASQ